jgi:hypothetical protein
MSTRTFVGVILVVLILLTVNLLVFIIYSDKFLPDDVYDEPPTDEHPWLRKVPAQVIREDSVWVERTGRLDRPVRIVDGGTLRLVDCHLELHHDDVPWFEYPFFVIEEGGALEVIDSTIEAVPGTIPDDALVGPFPDDKIPQISRVVNLGGTERPILSFDLRWRFWGTPLSVAVQRDHYSDLEVLERIAPEGSWEGWEHVEVSLADYSGYLPRVVIYFSEQPKDVYFIRDLNITDDGKALPFDIPLPEDATRGPWNDEAFYEYRTALIRTTEISRTIQCNGSLMLRGSTIRVPTEVRRFGFNDFDREYIPEIFLTPNTRSSIGGMHIQVDGGSIDARDSIFENAAIRATESVVQVSECVFESPYDMISMNHCSGTLTGVTFTRKGENDGLAYYSSMRRSFWAVSVHNNTNEGPVTVVDCKFQGVEQAIDLGYAIYSIENCMFDGVEDICIWEHAAPEPTPWEALKSDNIFQRCPGQLFISTGRTDLFFNSSDISLDDNSFIDTDGEPVENITTYPTRWMYWSGNRTRLIKLDLLVESSDSIRIVNHTEVSLYTYTPSYRWFETKVTVIVPAGVLMMHVDEQALFNKTTGDPWNDVNTDANLVKVWPSGDAQMGTYNLTYLITSGDLLVDNVSVDIYLDDEVFRHVDEEEFWQELNLFDMARLETSLYLTPGVHDLRVVIAGNRFLNETLVNDTSEVFFDETSQIMRASTTNTSTEIERFVRGEGVVLAIDANTTFELRDFQPVNGTWYDTPTFFITGGRGSGLRFSNLTSETDLIVSIGLFSHVDLSFIDTMMPWLWIVLIDDYLTNDELMENDRRAILGEISVRNCTLHRIQMDVGQYSMNITDSNGTSGVTLFSRANSTVFMENVTGHYWTGWASGPVWSYTIKDCHFWGHNSSGLRLNIDDIGKISITNTTFNGASLGFEADNPYIGHWELDVSDCWFIGENALLYMLWNTYSRNDWGEIPSQYPLPQGTVSGNTFSGNGTAVVIHPALYERTFVNNTLDNGVRAWAWYWTTVYPEPETFVHNDYELIVLEPSDLLTEFPEPFKIYMRDENYYYDVTEQVGGIIEHPKLQMAIYWYNAWGYGYILTAVIDVDLSRDPIDITYPVWPDIQDLLPAVIDDWPWN